MMTFFRLKTEIIIFIGDLDSYGIRYNSYPGSALAFMRIRILGEGISNQNLAFQTKIASIKDKWHKIGKKYLLRQFQLIDSVSVLCLGHFGDFLLLGSGSARKSQSDLPKCWSLGSWSLYSTGNWYHFLKIGLGTRKLRQSYAVLKRDTKTKA